METSKLYLSRDGFLLEKSGRSRQPLHWGWCMCCRFFSKKILLLRQFWAWSCTIPLTPFCTTATINNACLQCLMPSVAEIAGACNAACPWCIVPFLAKTAGACCRTQLARNVLCPHWPRPLGLAVHTVSLPTMSKPLWRDRHLACCVKIVARPQCLCPCWPWPLLAR